MLHQTLYGIVANEFCVSQCIKRVIQIMDVKILYECKLSYVKMQVLAALLIFQET